MLRFFLPYYRPLPGFTSFTIYFWPSYFHQIFLALTFSLVALPSLSPQSNCHPRNAFSTSPDHKFLCKIKYVHRLGSLSIYDFLLTCLFQLKHYFLWEIFSDQTRHVLLGWLGTLLLCSVAICLSITFVSSVNIS